MSEPLTYEEAMATSYLEVMPYMTANHGLFEVGICIYCRTETKHSDIIEWYPDANGHTAVCNNCCCDAIVPDVIFSGMTPQQKEFVINTWNNNGFGDDDN
jgi:NAD-dependent SIR2 family protein deacetylase